MAMVRPAHRILASAAIVIATVLVYHEALSAYFFDDDFQVLVSTWSFRPAQLFDIAHRNHFYRPVLEVYFVAATALSNGSPAFLHLANIALHAANGVLLLSLAYSMSGNAIYAFLAALVFVLQPSDMQAIAWVTALGEALGAFFGCLSLLAFLRFREAEVFRGSWSPSPRSSLRS